MNSEASIRAEQARQILNNPVFEDAFSNAREAIIAQLEATTIIDKDLRNELGLMLACLAGVKSQIIEHIQTDMLDSEEFKQ